MRTWVPLLVQNSYRSLQVQRAAYLAILLFHTGSSEVEDFHHATLSLRYRQGQDFRGQGRYCRCIQVLVQATLKVLWQWLLVTPRVHGELRSDSLAHLDRSLVFELV